jgi:UDPglucose--hexose-1-phosphate uridylyltransferase
MSELRQNRATKNWVIVATERARRPDQFRSMEKSETLPPHDPVCPFCPGNEGKTPSEVHALREKKGVPNGPGWQLRVVPNKFAALQPVGDLERREERDFFRTMDGFGVHEVLIESPVHNETIGNMKYRQVEQVLLAYRKRYLQLGEDPRHQLVTIFRNNGERAGTSLAHPHSQIIATPIVPTQTRHVLEEAMRYYDDRGSCVYCDMIREEVAAGKRIVLETADFVVFEPFASRVPFETWILPKRHNASFGNISAGDAAKCARVLRKTVGAMYERLGNPDYNYVFCTAPFKDANESYYHWHVEILPRLTTPAGFELGSGIYITVALPEQTARFLSRAVAGTGGKKRSRMHRRRKAGGRGR